MVNSASSPAPASAGAAGIEQALETIGLALPPYAAPVATYVPYVLSGRQLIISGQLPMKNGKPEGVGKLGREFTTEQGQAIARQCLLNVLSQLKAACNGDFSRVKRALRLGVFVNCTEDFTDQSKVANGASDLLVQLMGEAGRHVRAAVGVSQLPLGAAVEVEAMFELA